MAKAGRMGGVSDRREDRGARMDLLIRYLAGGLSAGALYGLMALGLVLIYRASEVVNFGHGDLAMVSTFAAYTLLRAHAPLPLALGGAVLFGAALGALAERGLLRPARRRRATPLTLVVLTLGLALVLNGLAGLLWGHEIRTFPGLVSGPPLRLGPAVITREQLFNLAVGLLLALALYAFLRFTRTGLALRAVTQNPEVARLMGIPVDRILILAWGVGVGLGAIAGILAAPLIYLEPNAMLPLLIKGFAAAVLGGMTSLPGAVIGGWLLGILENLAAGYIATELKTPLAFALIVAVLVVRPAGLLGRPISHRV
jgi:branched-chain amino acid transport system permease protein